MLDCIEMYAGAKDRDADATIIWLHGLGADGHDFVPIVPELGLGDDLCIRFIFPHADYRAVTINGGMTMRAWYDIRALDLNERSQDEEGIRASAAQVVELIEREIARGVPASRIIVAGFSQGGAVALHVALRYPERLCASVILSAYLLLADKLDGEASSANKGLPLFMAHGEMDPVVPIQAGQLAYQTVSAAGYAAQWNSYPMPHAVHPREIADIGAFIRERLT